MAGKSTLDPDNLPTEGRPTRNPKGHDTRALGPSDSSDSGSDMAGPGLVDDDALRLDRGTNQDTEAGRYNTADAGPSIGDLGMDDTSDRHGTGEHLTAGKDPAIREDGDRDVDRLVSENQAGLGGGPDQAEEAKLGLTDEQFEERGDKDEPVRRRRGSP
jgi:hypothetical protein